MWECCLRSLKKQSYPSGFESAGIGSKFPSVFDIDNNNGENIWYNLQTWYKHDLIFCMLVFTLLISGSIPCWLAQPTIIPKWPDSYE